MAVAKLELDGKVYEYPIYEGSEGEKAIDISKLRAETGYVTADPGFGNTSSCDSAVTFLNGEKGILRYRGYTIEDLAEKSNFIEVSYLLMNKELPTADQYANFSLNIKGAQAVPYEVQKVLEFAPKTSHPMAILSSAFSMLAAYYPQFQKGNLTEEEKDFVITKLMGQMKVVAASYYRRTQGLELVPSDPRKTYCEDFLNMMFSGTGVKINEKISKALSQLLILHADHEQNCSTSTVRVVGSSQASVYAAVSAGITALWGPLHGGANQAVLEMLEEIQKDGGDYKKFMEKAKDKDDPFRLMGFGHRVYKNFDPRATIIKGACDTILTELGVKDPLLDIAKGLEEHALKDPYFVDRKLYPNVDFYSGIIYRALGIPTDMFTVMFAVGRLPGWLAQWRELTVDPKGRIARPRQIYIGEKQRSYISQKERGIKI